jgi:hypothetical protein
MNVKSLSYKIVGTVPLVMHNGRLANPLDSFAQAIKEVSGKRNKTEADYEEMARLEWLGGLYLLDGKPCVPGYVVEATLIKAARKQRKGKQAEAGLFVMKDFPLEYDGSRDPRELCENEAFHLCVPVRIKGNRIMRTRPIFQEWAVTVEVEINLNLVNEKDLDLWMETAGSEIGFMDWRPKYGRFTATRLLG